MFCPFSVPRSSNLADPLYRQEPTRRILLISRTVFDFRLFCIDFGRDFVSFFACPAGTLRPGDHGGFPLQILIFFPYSKGGNGLSRNFCTLGFFRLCTSEINFFYKHAKTTIIAHLDA